MRVTTNPSQWWVISVFLLGVTLFSAAAWAGGTYNGGDGSAGNPYRISDADVEGGCLDGFTIKRGSIAGVVTDERKGLDLGLGSCYNKFIYAKMLGAKEILENERSES